MFNAMRMSHQKMDWRSLPVAYKHRSQVVCRGLVGESMPREYLSEALLGFWLPSMLENEASASQ